MSYEERSLTDTVVVVSGASSGIGRATARELVDAVMMPEDVAAAALVTRRLRNSQWSRWSSAAAS